MARIFEVTVQTQPLKLSIANKKALEKANSYDWILFASQNTVAYFRKYFKKEVTAQVAAVGRTTAKTLARHGIKVSVVPEKAEVKEMVKALGNIKKKTLLFPRSAIAPHSTVREIRKRGAIVRVLPLYTTMPVPLTMKQKVDLLAGKFSAIKFKSPSGISGLMGQLTYAQKSFVREIAAQCIGPTTTSAAKKAGFRKVKDLSL